MKNEIRMNYPRTKYEVLNQKVKNTLNEILENFLDYSKDEKQLDSKYILNVDYEKYTYGNKISYVFIVSMYADSNHPSYKFYTITYDVLKDKIITINYLKNKISNLLGILSRESRNILKKDFRFINNPDVINMMIQGTQPLLNNFRNFVFSKNGFLLFFEPHQIAPYSYGNFKTLIPYNEFNKNFVITE